jgi:AhpD family alkylhydroperoxidase
MADSLALSRKTKELIAFAVAHVTQSPYCIRGHAKRALRAGWTKEQLMEAAWVASMMRAGAAWTHMSITVDAIAGFDGKTHRSVDSRPPA